MKILKHRIFNTKTSQLLLEKPKAFRKKLPKKFSVYLLSSLGIIVFYLSFIMSDRFATDAIIMIKKNQNTPQLAGIGAALGLGNVVSSEDERILLSYIQSPDLLKHLDNKLNLKDHYSRASLDFLSNLSASASREEFLDYYRSKVSINMDTQTGFLKLEAQAFSPEFSLAIMKEILISAEKFVNEISITMANQQVEFMKKEVDLAQNDLRREKNEIQQFQNLYKIFSPEGQINSLSGIIAKLEGELIEQEAQLNQYNSYLNESAPQIVQIKAKINALRQEIDKQKTRVVGDGDEDLSEIYSQYSNLKINLEFATQKYQVAISALEAARAEASRKLRHLVVVSSPQLADDARYPDRLYWIVTWSLATGLIYSIARLVISIIEEHKD